jgi:CheY-like chemotaxis protein
MSSRHRVLIAAQPEAIQALRRLLDDVVDVTAVHSIENAVKILERDSSSLDLIICTIAFHESRMLDFLQQVKRTPSFSGIPFLCCRVLRSVISDRSMNGMATACKEGGAVDLLDIAKLPENAAQAVLQTVVMTYVKGDQGSGSV